MIRFIALFFFLCSATVAQAEDRQPPTSRFYMESLLAARLNPLGFQERIFLSYRHKLSERDSLLFTDTHFSAGLVTTLTPAYAMVGPQIKFKPLALLAFRLSYEFIGTFGTFNQLQQFESLDVDYSDPALKDMGPGAKRIGGVANLEGRLQMKVGPIAVRNTFLARHYNIRADAGQIAFYDQSTDLLAPNNGWVSTNDLDLLMLTESGFTVGARWTAAQAHHGGTGQASKATHRVGPILAMTLFNHQGKTFNTPTVFLITQWHAQHPYRTGEVSSVWIPTVALGFAFTGDLVPW